MYIHYPELHTGVVITHYERLDDSGPLVVPTYLGFIGVATEIEQRQPSGKLIVPISARTPDTPPGWIRLKNEVERLGSSVQATSHQGLETMVASSINAWEDLLAHNKPTAVHLRPEEICRVEDATQTLPNGLIVAPAGYSPDSPATTEIFERYAATIPEMDALMRIEAAVRGLITPADTSALPGQYL